ncbi:MAG TPA: hypothetical protein VF175_06885 [Lacipirellula sp.]
MNPNTPLFRKIAYLSAFVILAIPAVWLGAPSTRDNEGGRLAQIRSDARLGQADLGAIDPASEAIRLATLGLRGIAVTMLWSKANDYKKTEDWTNFQATLDQLARLQPYFIEVWKYQAWNLSYNVSVEVDNVRDRFYYVKQGIDYLKEGIEFNRDHPTLLDDLGWFCGNKVGRADEHTIYRQLFKQDEDLRYPGEPSTTDNWLVSKLWYQDAIESIDSGQYPMGTKNPTTFYDSPARSQISYAEAIETEGVFGTRAKTAWERGGELWEAYGTRQMPSTAEFLIALEDLDLWRQKAAEASEELNALSPGLAEKMRQAAIDSFSDEQRRVWEAPPANPTPEESQLQMEVNDLTNITPDKIAKRIAHDQPEKAAEAQRLAKAVNDANERARLIDTNRGVANYAYWKIRCDLEQTPEALEARELAHDAKRQFEREGNFVAGRELYERSFDAWAAALEQFPELDPTSTTHSDLMDVIDEYVTLLKTLELSLADEEVADQFPLWDVVKANDNSGQYADAIAAYEARKSGRPAPMPESAGESLINPADAIPQ